MLTNMAHCFTTFRGIAAGAGTLFISAAAQAGSADANLFPRGDLTDPFRPLNVPVGTFYLSEGFDFTFGSKEGVFNDVSAFGVCGINSQNICDLVSLVDAQIVHPNSTIQGLTNFLFAEAGTSPERTLTLTAFDINFNVVATALNGQPLGSKNRTTFTIDRGGLFDIAFFSISGRDSFGVNVVTTGEIQKVPGPLPILGFASALSVSSKLRKRIKARDKGLKA